MTLVTQKTKTQRSTTHLRLHVADADERRRPTARDEASLEAVQEAFLRLTGRPLQNNDRAKDSDSSSDATREHADAAAELAEAVNRVMIDLESTRKELWKREAELAAGVPVVPHDHEHAHLALRLETVLRTGAEAVDCQAAAVYMLDDGTKNLKLRACWGLPHSRFVAAARPLRSAATDLEALVGHAVVLEDSTSLPAWQIPEEFRSAVCVPISSPTVPFGTLWVFCDRPRTFSDHDTNLIEIVAGRISADLEREMLLQQCSQMHGHQRDMLQGTQWQRNRLPRIKPLLDNWQIDGWTSQGARLGGDFHDWSVLPDGSLEVAVCDAQGTNIESALTAASVHTALKAHVQYGKPVDETVHRVNETLWTASTGDQFASLFYGQIQPSTGEIEFVATGDVRAAVIGDSVREIAVADALFLGNLPENHFRQDRELIRRGEVLAVVSGGVVGLLRGESAQLGLRRLWRLIQKGRNDTPEGIIEHAKAALTMRQNGDKLSDQTLLIAKRV